MVGTNLHTPPSALGTTPAIVTERIAKEYRGGVRAVEDLTISVGQGEVFGLLGPNGAGKTTSVSILTTRVAPTSGSARVAGLDIASQPLEVRRIMGVATQANTLDRAMTVYEGLLYHCMFFGMSRRVAAAAAREAIERFALGDVADRHVDKLSGGYARRTLLARATSHRPLVLFLDEPTLGLDPQSRISLWEDVVRLKADGTAVLLTTHYLHEAEVVCDRVAIMSGGKILAVGRPAELVGQAGNPRLVVAVSGAAAGLATSVAEMTSVLAVDTDGDRLEITCSDPHEVLGAIAAAAERAGVRVVAVTSAVASLESVFVALTAKGA